MLTSYGLCWNPSLGTWDVKWRVGVECQLRKGMRCIKDSGGHSRSPASGTRPQLGTHLEHGLTKLTVLY
jgi:hypothetical protein